MAKKQEISTIVAWVAMVLGIIAITLIILKVLGAI